MIVVLDASAAVEIVLGRKESEKLRGEILKAESVLAPELLVAEVTNTFWKYHQISEMPLDCCEEAVNDALSLVDQLIPMSPLTVEVFSASCMVQHPAYDLFYLVTARRFNARILSLDAKLLQCAKRLGIKSI